MRKHFTTALFLLSTSLLFFTRNGIAQTKQDIIYHVSSTAYADVTGSTMDAAGNMTIAGSFTQSADIGANIKALTGAHEYDAYVARISADGKLLWKKTFGGNGQNFITNLESDNAGNSYITGSFGGSFSVDGLQFDSMSPDNHFLAKLDNTGKITWRKTYLENVYFSNPLYCSHTGDIYAILYLNNSLEIDGKVYSNNNSGFSSLLMKYDKDGALQWSRLFTNKNGSLTSVAEDNSGHLYLGGGYDHAIIQWGADNFTSLTDTATGGLFLAKAAAVDGKLLWMKPGITTSLSTLSYIAIGGDGSIYTAGYFADKLDMQGFTLNTMKHSFPGTPDAIAMNFDTAGKVLWHQFWGSDEPMYPKGFCIDKEDHVYVCGDFDIPVLFGTKSLFSTKQRDGYLMQFDKAGTYLGSITSKVRFVSTYNQFSGLMMDNANKLYITGNTSGLTVMGDDTLQSPGQNTGYIWIVRSSFTGIAPDHITLGDETGLKIYPNPITGNSLTIEIPSTLTSQAMIQCMDASGKMIFSTQIENNTGTEKNFSAQIPDLRPGLYFVKLVSGNGVVSGKVLKE